MLLTDQNSALYPLGLAGSPTRCATNSEATVVGVLGQVGGDGDHVEVLGQVLGPVVDEDGASRSDREMRGQVAAFGITLLLREVAADKVVHLELPARARA